MSRLRRPRSRRARFFADHMLTTASGLAASVAGGSAGTLALEVEQF